MAVAGIHLAGDWLLLTLAKGPTFRSGFPAGDLYK